MRSTITAQPGLHSLYSTGSGGATTFATGFATGFIAALFTTRFTGRARRPVERVVRVARMVIAFFQPVELRPARICGCLSF
jgi:multisubunit Na+/H+ antiporter MnhE subunit